MKTTEKEKLNTLLGSWEGTTKTWFDASKPPAEESPNKAIFKQGVNDNFIIHEYESSLEGKSFKGMAIYGYDEASNKFQSAWVDSFHMSGAIMFSEGDTTEKGFSVLGSYIYNKIKYGWRTQIEILDKDNIIITAYNIISGKEEKGLETVYKRI